MKCNLFFKKLSAKKSIWVSLPTLVLIVVSFVLFLDNYASSQPVSSAAPCTVGTLNGSYGFLGTAFDLNEEFWPTAILGRITFDGEGKFSGSFYFQARPGPVKGTFQGTYKVQPNCTGSITNDNGVRSNLVIVNGGNEYYSILTGTNGVIATSTAKKQ